MKKLLSILIVLVFSLSAFALTSCGGEESDNSDGDSEALSFFAYQPDTQEKQDTYKKIIAKFIEQTGIDVKVNFIAKDDYNTSIRTALLSNKKPDVAYLDQPLTSNFVFDGYLTDLTNIISSSQVLSKLEYFPGAYETTVVDGKNYAIPFSITTSVLFVNKDLVSEPIDSWEEWLNLKVPDGKSLFDGIGSGGYSSWYYQVFLENVGGSFMTDDLKNITFNNEKGVEAAKMIQDLYIKSDKNIRNTNNAFGQGLVLTKLGNSSDIGNLGAGFPNLDFDVQVIPPVNEGGTSYSNIGGENLVIFENCKQKDNAVKFVEYLMSEEAQLELKKIAGSFSSVKKYAAADESDPYFEMKNVVIKQLETACPRPAVPAWIDINDNYLGTALENILADDATADVIKPALDRAANQAMAKLEEFK